MGYHGVSSKPDISHQSAMWAQSAPFPISCGEQGLVLSLTLFLVIMNSPHWRLLTWYFAGSVVYADNVRLCLAAYGVINCWKTYLGNLRTASFSS